MSALAQPLARPGAPARARLAPWWPLAALTIAGAALRLSTLGLQSFWYDEAFTPVHVLHASLWATLRSVVHTENTPPLWYVIAWADARVLGSGEVALRLPSAIAGIATIPLAWMIGAELAGRRAAAIGAALVAFGPLFVWYSQEARAYSLFVLCTALSLLFFLRARRDPRARNIAAFAVSGALALLSHYFAVFVLAGMVALLLAERRTRRATAPAAAALALVGVALLPMISAQHGRGTQWIGRWPLGERLEAIPQYYLTGPSGAPLGHGIELLVALPLLAGALVALWPLLSGEPLAADAGRAGAPAHAAAAGAPRGALVAAVITAFGVLVPIVLVAFGLDYLAPRNLVGAMVALGALIGALLALRPRAPLLAALAATGVLALLAISIDVDLSPRLQRGDWRGVARVLRGPARERAITTVELGAAPLEYYVRGLHNLPRGGNVTVTEIDETGYAPLRRSARRAPAPGFRLLARRNVNGLIVYRFVSSTPRVVSEETLRRHVITLAHPEVLVFSNSGSRTAAEGPPAPVRASRPERKI